MELEKEELTIQDVLDAIHLFADNTQEKFESIDKRFDVLENNLRSEIGKARDAALMHADTKAVDAVIESGKKINQLFTMFLAFFWFCLQVQKKAGKYLAGVRSVNLQYVWQSGQMYVQGYQWMPRSNDNGDPDVKAVDQVPQAGGGWPHHAGELPGVPA